MPSTLKVLIVSFFALVSTVGQAQTVDSKHLSGQVQNILTVQADAWNQGNLKKFMSTYWHSPKLSFSSGGKTTFGWQATYQRYQRNYAPPKEMGKLKFSHLLVSSIEKNSALVLGNWALQLPDGSNPHGNFSLVLKKIDGQWKIIHDHTSVLKNPIPVKPDNPGSGNKDKNINS